MTWATLFSLANGIALVSWATLIVAPRWAALLALIRYGVIVLFCIAYAALVLLFFFRIEGGGFGTLLEVRALFASDPALLAGWLHYLAFDLFVGLWIAERADARGLNRFIQAPLLFATFMFGPFGLLMTVGFGLIPAFAANPRRVRLRHVDD
jgi:Domain of unknown function (DUF4281)